MNRIEFIARLTKGYDTVIDIGSDHGLVLKHALDNNYIKHAIASDVNIGPLNHAKMNLAGYPVRFYLSNGFKQVNMDYDLAIITGMGPHLIINILTDVVDKAHKTYILGANEKVEILRSWLAQNGFIIKDEHVIFDGFYYVFLVVEKGHMVLSASDIYLGPILKTKLYAKPYLYHKYKHYLSLTTKVKGEKLKEILEVFKLFEEFFR